MHLSENSETTQGKTTLFAFSQSKVGTKTRGESDKIKLQNGYPNLKAKLGHLGGIWAPKWHQNRTQKRLKTGSVFLLLKKIVTLLQGDTGETPRRPWGDTKES